MPLPSPLFFDHPCDTPHITADLDIIDDQLHLPDSAPFGEIMRRVRCFDKSPANGGWYPRPPPAPLDPAKQAPKPWQEQQKGEGNFRSRVLRAGIPHAKQKEVAWLRLARRALDAAKVQWVVFSYVFIILFYALRGTLFS